MKIKFIGATESVTGSKHLVITEKGSQVLLDCGLYQGAGKETDELNRKLGVNPVEIESLILSHAHIDHSGNIPLLVKQGFTGKIYCTSATADVCRILLLDSAHIHESDVNFINKRRRKSNRPTIKPLYKVEDAERSLTQMQTVPYNTDTKLNSELSFYFSGNGHIPGSAAVNLTANESGRITRLAYTGDIGRYSDRLMKPPGIFGQADHIICESTYGNRLHDSTEDVEKKILSAITRTCVENRGKLVIPAFSLGRTQEILYILDRLKNQKQLPEIRMFVDSPLSAKATRVVRNHYEEFIEQLRDYIKNDPDPFGFVNLKYIESVEESMALNFLKEPCVIISASGMCEAGRVKHHLRNTISDPSNMVLITGYCAPGTLGAHLLAGDKRVHIFGDEFAVNARVDAIESLSAHADYLEMIKYLSCQDRKNVKTVFLVHGDPVSKTSFRDKLLKEGFPEVIIPGKGEIHDLAGHS
jgi:metallo-beta-lactamase family protein